MKKITLAFFMFFLVALLYPGRDVSAASYLCKEGDTMPQLEKRLGITEAQIRVMNPSLSIYKLYNGDEVVFVDGKDKVDAKQWLNKKLAEAGNDEDFKKIIKKDLYDLEVGIKYYVDEEGGMLYCICLEYAKKWRGIKGK